jgi:hypothetical protein
VKCYDCAAELPSDSAYDVCASCIRAEREAYADKQSCAASLPERQHCMCGQHEVRQ